LRHPPGDRPAPHLRLRHPFLPRRRPGAPRRARRARRDPEALPGVGGRPREREAVTHLHGSGLGDAARLHPVTDSSRVIPLAEPALPESAAHLAFEGSAPLPKPRMTFYKNEIPATPIH